jgi:threonylcarbamoyladenosine tRNA methylthiotransferase MtaB
MRSAGRKKRASLHTLGCRLNQSETSVLEEKLVAAGYALVPFGEAADLGIIHTCTVTREADAKSRKMLRQFVRRNPAAYTAVIGCYAQMAPETIGAIDGVDLVVGNQEKLNVLDYVAAGKNAEPLIVRDRMLRDDFTIDFVGDGGTMSRRTNLKIQDGCDFMCSFCVIPFARGRGRSRDLENLVAEGAALVARGAREIVLTGVNIGTYGSSENDIVTVVDRLDAIAGLDRIRISSIEPTTIPVGLFDRMKDAGHALLPYLHIPLQSGSNRVLEAMGRKYRREEFIDFVNGAAAAVPNLGIGTDVMVGFPGETDEDFEDTCAVLRDTGIFYGHVFKYSEREGTASVRMGDTVAPEIAAQRSATVIRLSAEKTRGFSAAQAGRELGVLFEHQREGVWTGYTENYVRVGVRSEEDLTNVVRRVRGVEVCGDILFGTVETLAKTLETVEV